MPNNTPSQGQLACHECDLMVSIPELSNGQKATCPRCGFVFTRFFKNARSRLLALSTTSLIFMLLMLIFPFLNFTSQGNQKTVFFIQSIQSMGEETYLSVVILMLITTLIIPFIILVSVTYVLISSKLKQALPYTRLVLRMVFYLQPWNMAEIFLLGILVSMVKIASLATVQFGWSFYAFIFYIASMAATRIYFDRYQLWNWLSHHQSDSIDAQLNERVIS